MNIQLTLQSELLSFVSDKTIQLIQQFSISLADSIYDTRQDGLDPLA
jgi:hypothetical protein